MKWKYFSGFGFGINASSAIKNTLLKPFPMFGKLISHYLKLLNRLLPIILSVMTTVLQSKTVQLYVYEPSRLSSVNCKDTALENQMSQYYYLQVVNVLLLVFTMVRSLFEKGNHVSLIII